MNNFKPGGIRHRREDLGGRPKSDADYSPRKRFDKKPRHDPRGGGGYDNNRAPKEMQLFSTTCTTCGKSCEVPFRPDGTKPVLCRDCFANKNAAPAQGGYNRGEQTSFGGRQDRKPERNYESSRPVSNNVDLSAVTKQIAALEFKVTQILDLLKKSNESVVVENTSAATLPQVPTEKVNKTKKVVAKKVAAKKTVAKKVVKKATKKVVSKK